MTQISLSKILAILDEHRGKYLKSRKEFKKYEQSPCVYICAGKHLDLLNKLKKEFSNLSDTDQIPLGL